MTSDRCLDAGSLEDREPAPGGVAIVPARERGVGIAVECAKTGLAPEDGGAHTVMRDVVGMLVGIGDRARQIDHLGVGPGAPITGLFDPQAATRQPLQQPFEPRFDRFEASHGVAAFAAEPEALYVAQHLHRGAAAGLVIAFERGEYQRLAAVGI